MADDLQQHSLCLLFAVCVRVHCAVLGEQPRCRHRFWCGWVAGCVSSCYGGHSVEETPGSIPNPEAKLDCADGTALGRVWESRSSPGIICRRPRTRVRGLRCLTEKVRHRLNSSAARKFISEPPMLQVLGVVQTQTAFSIKQVHVLHIWCNVDARSTCRRRTAINTNNYHLGFAAQLR